MFISWVRNFSQRCHSRLALNEENVFLPLDSIRWIQRCLQKDRILLRVPWIFCQMIIVADFIASLMQWVKIQIESNVGGWIRDFLGQYWLLVSQKKSSFFRSKRDILLNVCWNWVRLQVVQTSGTDTRMSALKKLQDQDYGWRKYMCPKWGKVWPMKEVTIYGRYSWWSAQGAEI